MAGSFAAVDLLVLGLYAAALAGVAVVRGRRRGADDAASYLAAGRAVTLPGFVMNLVATWYGGVLGVGEYSYRYGAANWVVFGVPYYVTAVLFAFFIAPRARRTRALTIPDQLRSAYGERTGMLGAVVLFAMTLPGAYLLMAGTIAAEVVPVPRLVAVVAIVILSSAYLFFGGMRAIVTVDRIYFVLMYAGFALMVGHLWSHFGGLGFLRSKLDPVLFTWNGGQSAQAILVWYVIALAALVEPSFYESVFAARDARTARNGILISVLFWAVFDFMTTTTGLYARALLPNLADPTRAFPLLAESVLPPLVKGLFFVGMLATVMSTVDSYLFIAAQTLGHDLLARWRRAPRRDNRWTRIGLVVACAGSVAVAASGLSIVQVWHHLGSIGTPALLVPLVASFEPRLRMRPPAAFLSMAGAAAIAALWIATAQQGVYWGGLEPIFPALGFALLVWTVDFVGRRGARRVG